MIIDAQAYCASIAFVSKPDKKTLLILKNNVSLMSFM